MKDVYYVYMSPEKRTTEIKYKEKIKIINSFDIINEINLSRPSVVFINQISYIINKYPGGKIEGETYQKHKKTEIMQYTYGQTIFRNIKCFTSGQSVEYLNDIYPNIPLTAAMEKFIIALNPKPDKVRYTLGYYTKRSFYSNIEGYLWEFKKAHKSYYYDLDVYNDMMVANKAGAMSRWNKYAENILCFDIRSAYASVMVNDDHFPIGQTRKLKFKQDTLTYVGKKIKSCLTNQEWFKIVIDGLLEGFEEYYDEEAQKTGLEYNNVLDLIEAKRFKDFWNKITCGIFYYNTETGRLPYELRAKIIQCFDEKESCVGVEKFFKKTEINIIYGKGIQKYNFKNKWDLQEHYRGKGRNYLNPEQSLHCHAVVSHRIHQAIRNNIAVYWDTDGIKVKDTKQAREYFNKENEIIRQKNIESGFVSEIGTWKLEHEASEFICFGAKRYIMKTTDGNYDITWCGVLKKDQQTMLNLLGEDKIQNILKSKCINEIRRTILVEDLQEKININKVVFEEDNIKNNIKKEVNKMTFGEFFKMKNENLMGYKIVWSDGTSISANEFIEMAGWADEYDFIMKADIFIDEMNLLIKFSTDNY